jgi:hypothetical protein
MCPDNDAPATPDTNTTPADEDKFRRTVEPSVGPNVDGPMNQIVNTHTRDDEAASNEPAPATTRAPVRDIEPSMPAPDVQPQEG